MRKHQYPLLMFILVCLLLVTMPARAAEVDPSNTSELPIFGIQQAPLEGDVLEMLGFKRNTIEQLIKISSKAEAYIEKNLEPLAAQLESVHKKVEYAQSIYDVARYWGASIYASTMVISATYAVVNSAQNSFFHALDWITRAAFNERLLAEFHEAREHAYKLAEIESKVDLAIDMLLSVIEKGRSRADGIEVPLVNLSQDLQFWSHVFSYQKAELEDKITDPETDLLHTNRDMWKSCRKEIIQTDTILEDLGKITRILDHDPTSTVCNALKNIYLQNIVIKDTLENYRADMLAARAPYLKELKKNQADKRKRMRKVVQDSNNARQISHQEFQRQSSMLLKRKLFSIQLCESERSLQSRANLQQDFHQLLEKIGGNYQQLHHQDTFFLTPSLRRAVCEAQFELQYGERYRAQLNQIEQDQQEIRRIHQEYQTKIETMAFNLPKEIRQEQEDELALLEKNFTKIAQEQQSASLRDHRLKQHAQIEALCGKMELDQHLVRDEHNRITLARSYPDLYDGEVVEFSFRPDPKPAPAPPAQWGTVFPDEN